MKYGHYQNTESYYLASKSQVLLCKILFNKKEFKEES